MTINDIIPQITEIKTMWRNNIVTARPQEESQLQGHMGPSASYSTVSSQFDGWLEILNSIAAKPRVSRSLSKPVLMSLQQTLAALRKSLDYAGNGVDWIFTHRGTGQWLTMSGLYIRELIKDSTKEHGQIIEAAQERLSNDLQSIQNGAEIASQISLAWPDIEERLGKLEAAHKKVAATLESITNVANTAKEKISERTSIATDLAEEKKELITEQIAKFDQELNQAREKLSDAAALKISATELLANITSKAEIAKTSFETASEDYAKATAKQQHSNDRLTLALKNAQMEGLAGSFTRMADQTKTTIESEQKRFERALVYLALVGLLALVIELTYGAPKTIQEFSFRLIRTLSFAVPGIWVAWLASRKLGALNRVFSDYQYKSAAALAYESYRQAVETAEADVLKQQLLAFAIHSFGENPTQYYDAAKNEATSPVESWFEKISSFRKETKLTQVA